MLQEKLESIGRGTKEGLVGGTRLSARMQGRGNINKDSWQSVEEKMAMVGEPELSMFSMPINHNNVQPHLMDWVTGEQAGRSNSSLPSRSRGQSDDSTYMTSIEQYQAQFPYAHVVSQQSALDMSEDYQHPTKVEAINNSDEFDYFSQGSFPVYNPRTGSSFMSQPQQSSLAFSSSPSVSQPEVGGAGVLEEIDCFLRNFSDVPQQQNQDLDPQLYGDSSFLAPQQQQLQGGMYNGNPALGQRTMSTNQWVDSRVDQQAALLIQELLQQDIMSDSSSSVEARGMGPETSYVSLTQGSMGGYYSEGARASSGLSQNWGVAGSGGLKTPNQQPQMMMKQELSAPRIISSALGGGAYCAPQPDPNFFRPHAPTSIRFCPSPSLSPMHQLSSVRLPHTSPVSEQHQQVIPGTVVPATGLQLVHLLLACAEAVHEHKMNDAAVILERLRIHVQANGNPMQRLAAYFEQALTARLAKDNHSAGFKGVKVEKPRPQAEILEAFSVFYDCIPIGKFGHLTSNQILLDAVEREKVVHVLDLHIWHGMQWPAFLQALTLRPGGPPKLRMSAVGTDPADLKETGEKLHECAKNLNVPFEFCPILSSLENFNADMVELRRGEVLIVNSFVQFHGVLNKGPNCLNMLLNDLRRLNPRVMAFAENDGNHNSPLFLNRFVECLRYYSAVFDAFDASLPPDSPARMKMEEIFAAHKIMNIIACEGPDRVDGHETMKYWHKRMEAAHFRCLPLSSRAVSQANLLLNLYYSNGYTLNTSECGYLALGWHGMPLMGVSAWH